MPGADAPTRFDVLVVGGGTAGCVLAARLSESPDRSVCLLEAGPDYGPFSNGGWPEDMADARRLPTSHDWGTGGEDDRTLGARILGGCSAHNACVVVRGTAEDYEEWGPGWEPDGFAAHLDRAREVLRTASTNTDRPAPLHAAVLEAAGALGFELLDDPDDPARPTGVCAFPANAVDGIRWNTAFAYLDPARARSNLTIVGDSLVDRVLLDASRATGVITADGRTIEADTVVLAAGAYFTPTILVRSGIGPEAQLRDLGIHVVTRLPVGETLLDHCGTGIAWEPSERLNAETADHERDGALFEPHTLIKAASTHCPAGTFDLHFLPWIAPSPEVGRYEASMGVFHMKPSTSGWLRLQSRDPAALPVVRRGFLDRQEDVDTLVEGLELGRELAATPPLRDLLETELRPGSIPLELYLRETVRNYFHPAGTCPIGTVVDSSCRVLGIEGLVLGDASVMPTIPRANTNLPTAAIAERIATTI